MWLSGDVVSHLFGPSEPVLFRDGLTLTGSFSLARFPSLADASDSGASLYDLWCKKELSSLTLRKYTNSELAGKNLSLPFSSTLGTCERSDFVSVLGSVFCSGLKSRLAAWEPRRYDGNGPSSVVLPPGAGDGSLRIVPLS